MSWSSRLLAVALGAAAVWFAMSARVVKQYERGLVFRLGRLLPGIRGPGLNLIAPGIDRLRKVNMQIVTMPVPAQDGITKDNVTVKVDAVVYFNVADPQRAIVNVQDYQFAVGQVAQTSLRSMIGKSELDDLLSNREKLNQGLEIMIDSPALELGHPHRPGGDQGRRAARSYETVDVPAGRGGTGAAGTHHHRRRGVAGVPQALPGG